MDTLIPHFSSQNGNPPIKDEKKLESTNYIRFLVWYLFVTACVQLIHLRLKSNNFEGMQKQIPLWHFNVS